MGKVKRCTRNTGEAGRILEKTAATSLLNEYLKKFLHRVGQEQKPVIKWTAGGDEQSSAIENGRKQKRSRARGEQSNSLRRA